MTALTIIVEFETREGREDEFITLIREHARKTLEEEPGCLRFEVIKPIERDGTPIPNNVMVNELYANEAAVTAIHDFPGVVDDILQVRPQTRQVFMVIGSGVIGKFWRHRLEEQFSRFHGRLTFVWSDDLSLQ